MDYHATIIPTPDHHPSVSAAGGSHVVTPQEAPWNISGSVTGAHHRLMTELRPHVVGATSVPMVTMRHPFPTVDVPDHAHYTIGIVILVVGITGMVGNFLVLYAFCRSRTLRTPSNLFIINLALADFLMCVTQAPIFFTSSMHKRWIFGEKGCELYAFAGALTGICSMITLVVIAVDRYVVITRPLASLGAMSRKKALCILAGAWLYSMGWSLPPFFGWSAYVPEGLLTSCSWDYVTFTPSVRSYTMLLFTFVFFIPLGIICFCYCNIFRTIRCTTRAVTQMSMEGCSRSSMKKMHKMKSEWKMAKIALLIIFLYVISWAPYSCVALTAFAGYADLLNPYMNSVPAVIAKASAIHNPIIYAITHPKYRSAISRYIPCLGALLRVPPRSRFATNSSFQSTRRSTVTSQSSDHSRPAMRPRLSSDSDSESGGGLSDIEVDPSSSFRRRPASRQSSGDSKLRRASQRSKLRGRDSGVFERASTHSTTTLIEAEDISMSIISLQPIDRLPAGLDNVMEEKGSASSSAVSSSSSSVIVTTVSSPSPSLTTQPCFCAKRRDDVMVMQRLETVHQLVAPLTHLITKTP